MNNVKKYDRVEYIYDDLISCVPQSKNKSKLVSDLKKVQNSTKLSPEIRREKFAEIFTLLAIGCSIGGLSTGIRTADFLSKKTQQQALKVDYFDTKDFRTSTGKIAKLSFYNNHVQIEKSYHFNFDERMETLEYFISYTKDNNLLMSRDIKSLESEWYIHNVCYNLGIKKDSSKDVDLEYIEDNRWYVNFAVDVAETFHAVRASIKDDIASTTKKDLNMFNNKQSD